MIDDLESDQLDTLLARPALLADRGFSKRVALRASYARNRRRNLFLLMGLAWFVLMFITASPQAVVADIVTLAQSLDIGSLYPYVLDRIQSFIAAPEQLPYSTIAAAVLSLLAIASITIRV